MRALVFFLEKGKRKKGVLGESLVAINSQQGEDWGKRNGLILKNVKRKDLPLPAVLLAGRLAWST